MTEAPWKQQAAHARSVAGVLSPAECEAVRQMARGAGLTRSMVYKRGDRQSSARTSEQAVLRRTPETEWLYERLRTAGEKVNAEHWRFAITGLENMQVLRYRPMQRFRWHLDSLPGSGRKITCVINLADPRSHWRGKLEVMGSHEDRRLGREQGGGTFFPSYLVHRATAPLWGERWSLVTWLNGPDLV